MSQVIPQVPPITPKQEVQDMSIEEEEKEETKTDISPTTSKEIKTEDLTDDQKMDIEIEMLQNDGRFRGALLHQLNEINKALVTIADILVNLGGQNGK